MTYETGKLDVMATVENEQMQGGVLLAYDLSDSLNFLSTRGQLRIDELAAFGLDIKGDWRRSKLRSRSFMPGRKIRVLPIYP